MLTQDPTQPVPGLVPAFLPSWEVEAGHDFTALGSE